MEFTETTIGQSKETPAKMVIYGVPKIGKTNFASQIPDAFFINLENGLDYLPVKVRSTPHLKTFEEVIGWLKHIYENDSFKCNTIVIDSIDWLEQLAQKKIEKLHNNTPLSDMSYKPFAFQKGYAMAGDECIKVISWLDAIYNKKGIKALLICHSKIKTMDLPNKDPYSKYMLKLVNNLAAKVNEWADLILFADYSFFVSKDSGKPTEPKRMLMAGGEASYEGGGRMQLKKEIPLNYNELKKEIENGK